jgi:vitamin B12/bleomycin/antimicrobial peptide transport system ATP-binding/permease protein
MDQYFDQCMNQFLGARHYTAWQLIKAYWQSDQRFPAYVFFSIVVIMTVSLVGLDVAFNYWYNYFYNALQAYDQHGAIRLLVVFFVLAAFYIILYVYRYYISQLFGLRWRRWLTAQLIGRWLQRRSYYLIENFDVQTDNPDQRIQEDVSSLVNYSIDLSMGLIGAITTFILFIYILWQLSGELTISLGSWGTYQVPGYLVWVGILYAFIGTFCTFKLGRPLISLNFEQQRREASFRFAAMDLRSHAEDVALYKGEEHQKSILQRLFGRVLDNWYLIILRQKLLFWFTSGYNQAAVVLPLLVALPNYFDKVFLLGGLMQSIRAFSSVQDSLSYMINSYTQIAQWQAVAQRLTTFVNHMQDAEIIAEKENQLIFKQDTEKFIQAKDVMIKTPQNKILLANINEKFEHGKHYLLKGESGIGKSTFVRAMAGIWPYAAGEVTFPEQQKVMYLPQKPYMPIGTLSEAILFPDQLHPELEKNLPEVLAICNLEKLIPRLSETASWSEQLSPGEQQRITFARVLLHKPDWVFLDESTSMLDIKNEKNMYDLLRTRLPNCSLISIGHRPSLQEFHDQIIDMSQYQG